MQPTCYWFSLAMNIPVSHPVYPNTPLTSAAAEEQVAKLMKDVGVTADKENLKHMIKALHGKSVPDHIRAGSAKMSTMSAGSSAASGKSTHA